MEKRLFSITWDVTIKKGGEKMKIIKPALELLYTDNLFTTSIQSLNKNNYGCHCTCY